MLWKLSKLEQLVWGCAVSVQTGSNGEQIVLTRETTIYCQTVRTMGLFQSRQVVMLTVEAKWSLMKWSDLE